MAKIENTSAYPTVVPESRDYFIITDISDGNKTKTASITSLQGFMGSQPPADKVLTSSQILSLQGSPLNLSVDNPDNDLIIPVSCAAYYTAGSDPFNFASGTVIRIQPETYLGTSNTYFEFDATLLNNTNSALLSPTNTWEGSSQTFPLATAGTDLVVTATNVSTQGDGKLKISVQYRLMSTT